MCASGGGLLKFENPSSKLLKHWVADHRGHPRVRRAGLRSAQAQRPCEDCLMRRTLLLNDFELPPDVDSSVHPM